jgi:hypothetical protein
MRAKTSIGSKLRYEYPIGRSIVKLRPTVLVDKDDDRSGENSSIKAILNLSLEWPARDRLAVIAL